jgi:Asp-tRNA(Asn)/Glu-tRNA(Gln) amidotransferase A subunit family amidase
MSEAMDVWRSHVEAREPTVRALLGEPGRWERIDRELALAPDGPLRGVLVGVKDIFHVEGFETRAGSLLPSAELAGPEAAAVTLLRAAGAVVLGKTVTTEFAYLEPGPTTNPHDPHRTPGGSSSGSAAAVASGYCPVALGSQTVGSTIRPAAYCGVIGFKPSYGRISTAGVIPLAQSFDTVGVLAAAVGWARRVASLLCAGWREAGAGRAPVLGVPDGPYLAQTEPTARETFERRLDGLEVRRIAVLADIEDVNARHRRLLAAEMARIHEGWFRRHEKLYRRRTAETILAGRHVPPDEVAAGRAARGVLRDQLHHVMDEHGIDAWVSPATTGPAPVGLGSTGEAVMNLPWTQAGMPAVTIPAGELDGMPLGLQLVGRFMDDERLLRWAEML